MQDVKATILNKQLIEKHVLSFLNTTIGNKFNCPNFTFIPGFCDVHVHFREPGFSYKETIKTGSMSASRGGYTAVCTMPNLKPTPDNYENLKIQLDAINKDALIKVIPYGTITVGQKGEELSNMQQISDYVVAFTDDGRGVQSDAVMEQAMLTAKKLNKLIVAHCEVNSLLNGGYIHDGIYCKNNNHRGICSASEYEQIARDVQLAKKTGVSYHVCHISTKESVEIIRKAKQDGVDITCETAPHYLVLDENNLQEDGKWKMNPPLRSTEDRLALIEGVKDGTINMIATDHAPHSAEEKSKGLKNSAFGIVGLETAFSVLYTKLILTNIISLNKLVDLLVINPRKRFNIPFEKGFSVWDLNKQKVVNVNEFLSMGKATPFENETLYGVNYLTIYNDKIVYKYNDTKN